MIGAQAAEAVLVCGLGRIGLSCIKALRGYRVPVRAIALRAIDATELDGTPLVVGDFRRTDKLLEAGVMHCRSVLLVSDDSAANLEGALAARRVNPDIRLVVRGQQQSLHALLSRHLGNLVVYEPSSMAAPAFAFAALDSHVLAHFYVDEHLFQVLDYELQPGDPLLGSAVEHVNMPGSQVLIHLQTARTQAHPPAMDFLGWTPGRPLRVGDRLLLLSTAGQRAHAHAEDGAHGAFGGARWTLHRMYRAVRQGLSRRTEVLLIGLGALAALLISAMLSFMLGPPHLGGSEALRLALMLLTGGHLADVFDPFTELPKSVLWTELVLTVTGTLLTAVLYAVLTDRLLTARFRIGRRPQPPARDHVIVAGLGATGERIADVLQGMQRAVVGVEDERIEPHVLPHIAVVQGTATDPDTLHEANLASAHGIVAATADDLRNVEIALLAQDLNPGCRVAVRTQDPRFSDNVEFLLPRARVLCVPALAATAYAAAALGEHVISLFQMLDEPVLVVEYAIASDDSLVGRALWEVAEGYAIVPVLLQTPGGRARVLGPDDATTRLRASDRLVVLATTRGLEAIERGELRRRDYELWLHGLRPYAEDLQVVGLLVHRLGYTLEQARAALGRMPARVPQPLYGIYASRTERMLHANGVRTAVTHVDDGERDSAAAEG